MKKHPVTWISIAALMALLICLTIAVLNSGLQYQELHAEAIMADDAELVSAIRAAMERANLFAAMHAMGSVIPVFLVWYVACAFIIIRRMRSAGITRVAERYCIPLFVFAAAAWWAHQILDSRPTEYHYDEYLKCILSGFGVECGSVLAAALAMYFFCHLPWRKRIAHR